MLFPTFQFVVFFTIVFTVYWSLPSVVKRLRRRVAGAQALRNPGSPDRGFADSAPATRWLDPHRLRTGWLLLASCAFYASWNPWLISLILFSASVDYTMALLIPRT